ncbi:hypothetical protein BT96DRAFT_1020034 [Gymnopus androsaceus JB14]|uniref:Uncharacterized protein n=1 Tax=Gymnopus androsaceus JB14 TaxID=1447944 RepID=A0A6A4HP93_9AGAR|nr:hypothetical protein BT96DRAFT_1020034 [Gymnopus androsaceus JB14]
MANNTQQTTLETTLGAIILGVPLAIMFSGVLFVECIIYWRSVKPTDTWRMSCIVFSLLILDMFHSSVLMASSWKWFIADQGMNGNFIPTTMALAVLIAGISILIHVFMEDFSINHKYWLTVPIMVLAVLRFILGCTPVSSAYMMQVKSFEEFRHSHGSWVFWYCYRTQLRGGCFDHYRHDDYSETKSGTIYQSRRGNRLLGPLHLRNWLGHSNHDDGTLNYMASHTGKPDLSGSTFYCR